MHVGFVGARIEPQTRIQLYRVAGGGRDAARIVCVAAIAPECWDGGGGLLVLPALLLEGLDARVLDLGGHAEEFAELRCGCGCAGVPGDDADVSCFVIDV